MQTLVLTLIAAILVPLFDFIWLGWLASSIYREELGALVRVNEQGGMAPILWAAGVVYLLLGLGITQFALPRAEGSWLAALGWGALIGCVIYGVYDFTNYSTLKDWPARIVWIDWAWGTFLCGIVSMIVCIIHRSAFVR